MPSRLSQKVSARSGGRPGPFMPCACPSPPRAAPDRTRGAPRPRPSNSPARPGKCGALRAVAVGPGSPCGPLCLASCGCAPSALARREFPKSRPAGGAMLISPMLFIVGGPRLLVSHRGGASGALRPPLPRRGVAALRQAAHETALWKAASGRYSRVSCSLPSPRSHQDTGANDPPPRR